MTLTDDPEQALFEYACHEGNYAMRNILSAARAEEARQAKWGCAPDTDTARPARSAGPGTSADSSAFACLFRSPGTPSCATT